MNADQKCISVSDPRLSAFICGFKTYLLNELRSRPYLLMSRWNERRSFPAAFAASGNISAVLDE